MRSRIHMNEEKKTIIAHITSRLFAPSAIEDINLSNEMEVLKS